ncbi:hypothetical protein KEM54_004432 [Ascosphaera aggregata]|nr:hypothetical protein KEM54_004432 [Ascosphaera aggregata]
MSRPREVTKDDAARIESTQVSSRYLQTKAKSGKDVGKGSFASRVKSAADRNANVKESGGKK